MRPTLANHSLGWGRLRVHGTSESAPREEAEGGVECVGSNLTFHLWFQTSGMGTTGQRMLQSILALTKPPSQTLRGRPGDQRCGQTAPL